MDAQNEQLTRAIKSSFLQPYIIPPRKKFFHARKLALLDAFFCLAFFSGLPAKQSLRNQDAISRLTSSSTDGKSKGTHFARNIETPSHKSCQPKRCSRGRGAIALAATVVAGD